tara:strand:+ start:224 stop:424 length:201 start_codon:yes stop_codon:yes gene_type:complete
MNIMDKYQGFMFACFRCGQLTHRTNDCIRSSNELSPRDKAEGEKVMKAFNDWTKLGEDIKKVEKLR